VGLERGFFRRRRGLTDTIVVCAFRNRELERSGETWGERQSLVIVTSLQVEARRNIGKQLQEKAP